MQEPNETKRENSPPLSRHEKQDVLDRQSLSARSVYTIIHRQGVEELARPVSSLWWSGVAAGLGISSSVLAEGILHEVFYDHPYRFAIENLGYTVGFVLVILGRLQLFTENTLTAILPLLSERRLGNLWITARLWAIILVANFAGTFLAMALASWGGAIPPHYVKAMLEVSHPLAELTPMQAFAYGAPAGFYVAAVVWMLPSAQSAAVLVIGIFTYLIAMGDFTHIIAGSGEVFLMLMAGQISFSHGGAIILATLGGNILGGTGLFALLAYGQVAGEMD